MKKIYLSVFVIFLLGVVSLPSSAFSLTTNTQAINLARYNQNKQRAGNNPQSVPYVYSEQQAKYYGMYNLPQSQFRQYGMTKDNTPSTPAVGQYGYYGQ